MAIWLALCAAATPFALRQDDHLTSGGYEVPGSQSNDVERTLRAAFPREPVERLSLLIVGRAEATRADYRASLADARRIGDEAGVRVDPRAAAVVAAFEGGSGRFRLPLIFDASFSETIDLAEDLSKTLRERDDEVEHIDVYLVGRTAQGAALQHRSKTGLADAERIGFPVVLIVLLAVFGSLAAAALPLTLGFLSVTLTSACVFFISMATPMSVFVTNVASMIGIGVAVDYALFMLVRYREEVRAGAAPHEAESTMLRTSGRAVIFSGLTVVLALATIFAIDNVALRSMAAGAIIVVSLSVLLATTLLPALIRLFGHRVVEPGRLSRHRARIAQRIRGGGPEARSVFWTQWTRRVMARPWLSVLASMSILVGVAVPAFALDVGCDTLRQLPEDDQARRGEKEAAKLRGAGAETPLLVTVGLRESVPERPDALPDELRGLRKTIARDPEVEQIGKPRLDAARRTLVLPVFARHDAEHRRAEALVRRLRRETVPRSGVFDDPRVVRVQVGGASANAVDLATLIKSRLWLVIALLLAVTYVLLLVLLRSVLLPLKAIIMNLLSVGAAYGVLVMVFQWDLFGGLGSHSVDRLQATAVPLILTVVFGLSMDYEIFLLTRIRERYDALRDNVAAVSEGVSASAPTITSAAIILVAVFAVFAATNVPVIQQIGVGTAVAIAIDATLTRLVLLPATMQLLGDWNWWLPRPLARLLTRPGSLHPSYGGIDHAQPREEAPQKR